VYFDNGFVISCLYASQGAPTCHSATTIATISATQAVPAISVASSRKTSPRTSAMGDPEGLEPASSIVMSGQAEPTIYDVARVAGVASSVARRRR